MSRHLARSGQTWQHSTLSGVSGNAMPALTNVPTTLIGNAADMNELTTWA
jgi:hypothetical protein